MKALTVTGLKKRFGGVAAVDDLSFHVEEREALGIIGPNGAGKTTVFNLITGLYRPDGGRVEFFGSDITGIDPVRPIALGIARTFQNLRLFKELTVLENVIVPILVKEGYGPIAAIFMSRTQMEAEAGARRRAAEILDLFHLSGKADALAGSLPYGEQRRVELARALAANPRLLLIDEPGAGMNPREIQALLADIREIKETFGLTVLIIEHQMGLVMRLSDRLVVMDFGKKIAEGPPEVIKKDPEVIRAYLGGIRMLMSISGLSVSYGPITALEDVSIDVDRGEIVSIIGANGAGKSTLLKSVAGILKPRAGAIFFKEREITRERPDRIVKQGICMVPEGRRIFPDLTVKENLELGAHAVKGRVLKRSLRSMVLDTFPRMGERLKQHAGTLSGGEQQMLALGRALMGNPEILLLDEPSMGLSPLITQETFSFIRTINAEKHISIVLVEQNAAMALDYSNRAYVLETGRVVLAGASRDVKGNPAVVEAYLGVEGE